MFLRAKPERQRGFQRSFSSLNTIPSKECIVVFVVLYQSYHMMGLRLKVLRKAFLVAGCQVIAYSVPRFSLALPGVVERLIQNSDNYCKGQEVSYICAN